MKQSLLGGNPERAYGMMFKGYLNYVHNSRNIKTVSFVKNIMYSIRSAQILLNLSWLSHLSRKRHSPLEQFTCIWQSQSTCISNNKRHYKTTLNPFSAKCGQGENSTKIHEFRFVKFWKQIAPFESTGREVSFEWLHHRILSTDSKVRTTSRTPTFTLAVKGLTNIELDNLSKAG